MTGNLPLDQVLNLLGACIGGLIIATVYWRFHWFRNYSKRFRRRSRAVIKGHVTEQIAPLLDDFPYGLTEVKFLGKPIDFIVFQGLDNESVEEVIFLEIKSGKSHRLSPTERSVREAVRAGRVRWELYTVP